MPLMLLDPALKSMLGIGLLVTGIILATFSTTTLPQFRLYRAAPAFAAQMSDKKTEKPITKAPEKGAKQGQSRPLTRLFSTLAMCRALPDAWQGSLE